MTRLHLSRPLALVAVTLAVLSALLTLPAPAQAAIPQLRVAVDNGRTGTRAGDSSVYTVTVTNLGSAKVKHLRLSQTVPTGARLVSAGSHGRLAKGQVTWTLTLPAAGSRTVRTTLKVDQKTPDTLLRLATVACVRLRADGPPLVCAADSDELPAGAAAAKVSPTSTTSPAASSAAPGSPWAYAGAGVGLLLLAGAAVLLVRRRRRSLTAPGGVGTPQ